VLFGIVGGCGEDNCNTDLVDSRVRLELPADVELVEFCVGDTCTTDGSKLFVSVSDSPKKYPFELAIRKLGDTVEWSGELSTGEEDIGDSCGTAASALVVVSPRGNSIDVYVEANWQLNR